MGDDEPHEHEEQPDNLTAEPCKSPSTCPRQEQLGSLP